MKSSRQLQNLTKKQIIEEYKKLADGYADLDIERSRLSVQNTQDRNEMADRIITLQNRCLSLQRTNLEKRQKISSLEAMITALRAEIALLKVEERHSIFNGYFISKIEKLLGRPVQICSQCYEITVLNHGAQSDYSFCENCTAHTENPWLDEPWWRKTEEGEYVTEHLMAYEYAHPNGTRIRVEPKITKKELK